MEKAITLEFSGGLDLLFKQKAIKTTIKNIKTIKDLLPWMKNTLLQERPELFLLENTIRPGILILINDVDWELKGELEYEICDNDTIVFISTLHGG